MRAAPSRNGAARSSPGCSASRPLKNASRVKIEFRASRVSEGSVFLRPPIWGIPRGRSPLFQQPADALSISRKPRADLHGAREAVHRLEQLELQVGVETGLAREALDLLERRGVRLPADERGEPVVDEEDLARALELGQGREREIE